MTDFISYGYALIIIAGGTMGYVKAGSTASLISGLLFGGLSAVGAYLNSSQPPNCALIFGSSLVLGGVMGSKALKSGKFMPAGLIALLSFLMVVRFLPRVSKAITG